MAAVNRQLFYLAVGRLIVPDGNNDAPKVPAKIVLNHSPDGVSAAERNESEKTCQRILDNGFKTRFMDSSSGFRFQDG